jgi:hypothetical protein
MFAFLAIAVAFGTGPDISPLAPDIARVQNPRHAIKLGMKLEAVEQLLPNDVMYKTWISTGAKCFSTAYFVGSEVTVVHLDGKGRVTRIERRR